MNIDFQKSRHIWQKKQFNMDKLSFVWQKSFIQFRKIFYMIDNFNQNLKTSNTMLQVYKVNKSSIRISFSQFHTFKKNFLFKISTIRTKKSTDISYNSFHITKRCSKILSFPRSGFNTQKL